MPESSKKDDATPLADRLVPDPKNPPELCMMQGWLGKSSEDKCRRLYLDPELAQSVEIPEDAIVYTQDIPREENPLGGNRVWVKADAAIKQGPGVERLYARFLRGQIQQDFLGSGAAAGVGGLVGAPAPIGGATSPALCQPIVTIVNCPTRQVWCQPSVFTICQSQLTICPTRPVICQIFTNTGPQCTPSALTICPTRVCPSNVDACPSAPGGCWDPTIVQTPVLQQQGFAGLQGGPVTNGCFDPGAMAGGLVGAPTPVTTPAQCQLAPTVAITCQSRLVLCQPSVIQQTCPTRNTICISRLIPCPTQAPQLCVTQGPQWCPTQTPHLCVTQGPQWCPTQTPHLCVTQGQPWCPTLSPQLCPSQLLHACPPSQAPQICPTMPTTCPAINCGPTFPGGCPTLPLGCPTVAPQNCPTSPTACPAINCGPTFPGGCPTLPLGCPTAGACPSGPVCGDPGGLGFDPSGMAGDPTGGLVGAPGNVVLQPATSPALCLVSRTLLCQPTVLVQQCQTRPPICVLTTATPGCVSRFCSFVGCPTQFGCPTVAGCPTLFCPSFTGCPSGPVCGGGGFPGGGVGF